MSGVLYGDKNRDDKQDPGEQIEGGVVTLVPEADLNRKTYKATSAADGTFSFINIPPGIYKPQYELPGGWAVHVEDFPKFHLSVGRPIELVVRAERQYSEQLTVTASLDRDNYRYPATVTVTVTLTNTSDRVLRNVGYSCDSAAFDHGLGRTRRWGEVFEATGVTLAAGESRTFTIDEALPEGSRKQGAVLLDCRFGPWAPLNHDGPVVRRTAAVSGTAGGYTMVLGEDRNGDARIDGDETVRNTKIVLLNPKTGVEVTSGTSGADGRIEFAGLSVGEYRAVVVGPWTFTDAGASLVRVVEGGEFGYRFLKRASPASLRSTVKFDKERYESHETARFDLTITNVGGQPAERVRLLYDVDGVNVPAELWGDLRRNGPGVQIPAGESRTFSLSGHIRTFTHGWLRLHGSLNYVGRSAADPSGYFETLVEVVMTTGDVEGVVYVDRNRNGQQDPGEIAPGTRVVFEGGDPWVSLAVEADANGRFSFPDVPSGNYQATYTVAGGWIVHAPPGEQWIRVEPGPVVQLTARAERPYDEMLKATVELDKIKYALGEEAKIAITLTNKSDSAISGIQADCTREVVWDYYLGYRLDSRDLEGWGDLLPPDPGVTLGPKETKTFFVTEEMPPGTSIFNKVVADCYFAPNAMRNTDGARGKDWARVDGAAGDLKATLAHDRNKNYMVDPGEAIANTRLVLRTHPENGADVVEAVSDADGNARFENIPAGQFWAWVDGPWKFEGDNGRVVIFGGEGLTRPLFVVPGPRPSPENDGGTGGGGTRDALAKTGASVLGLGVVAALLVAFGIGARVAGRRRSA